MIKEVFKTKIENNLDLVVDIIDAYFSHNYTKQFKERSDAVDLLLVRNKGVMEVGGDQVYVGDEAVCVKGKETSLIFPISFLEEKYGNVIFVHLVLHALFNDSLKEKYGTLYEVFVDYMANDIAKILEKKNVNVTLEKNPEYESNSVYSNCFDCVRDFCEENKRELVDGLVVGDASLIEGIDKLSFIVENIVDALVYEDIDEKKFKR